MLSSKFSSLLCWSNKTSVLHAVKLNCTNYLKNNSYTWHKIWSPSRSTIINWNIFPIWKIFNEI